MFFFINRQDRSGSILQLMFYAYSYCFHNNIHFDGIISNNVWWYNNNFFSYVDKYFKIKNKVININNMKKINFDQIKNYSNLDSSNFYTEFDVSKLCPYFSTNINKFFDYNFKKHIHDNNNDIFNCLNKTRTIISIHIRRGDVNANIQRRYTYDSVYLNVIDYIIEHYNLVNYEIHLFSEINFNGNLSLYNKYKILKLHLAKNNDIQEIMLDFMHMINSDFFVCSKSSFSYLPALLNKNGIVFHNNKFWNKPLEHFRIYNDDNGDILT